MQVDDAKTVRKYTVQEARQNFKDVVDGVAYTRQPAIVTKHGAETVAVVPYDLLKLFMQLEAMMDTDKARRALADYNNDGGITLAELKKELGIK